ncbi:hypothetical protein DL96DRAFT_1124072 [Flagelloscypha sp. PMI_526]|nr:hypothetical protein DL96DRAFT_1124072 [Flagelloscypha sp. PMI_526]
MLSHVFIVIGFVTATLGANTGYPPAPTYSCANNNDLKCCNSKNSAGYPSANGTGLLTVVGNILVPVSASCTNVNAIGRVDISTI